eukprot:1867235-Pyramimonas_sp.AAC.1
MHPKSDELVWEEVNITTHHLTWPCDSVVPGVSVDRAVAPVVLKANEFGRGRDLPGNRLAEIDA